MKQRFGGTGPEQGLEVEVGTVEVFTVEVDRMVVGTMVDLIVEATVDDGLTVVVPDVAAEVVETVDGFLVLRVASVSTGDAIRTQVTKIGMG